MDIRTKLDLGSGLVKQGKDWIHIDISPGCNPDYVWDVRKIPYPKEWAWDNKFEQIRVDNLAEHIESYAWIKVVQELHRILKPRGILWIRVPNVKESSEAAFGDPTHISYFHPSTFDYYDVGHRLKRWENFGRYYGIPKFKRVRQQEEGKFIIVELEKL